MKKAGDRRSYLATNYFEPHSRSPKSVNSFFLLVVVAAVVVVSKTLFFFHPMGVAGAARCAVAAIVHEADRQWQSGRRPELLVVY